MAPVESKLLTIQILQLQNGSYITGIKEQVIAADNTSGTRPFPAAVHGTYDGDGALMYVIAVILMYGFSILLMIGSSMRKSSTQDSAMLLYLKDNEKVRNLERKQEKFKAKLLMHNKQYSHILGSDRADITLGQDWFERHGISQNKKRMSISLDSFPKSSLPGGRNKPRQDNAVLGPLVHTSSRDYRSRGAYSALDIHGGGGNACPWPEEEEEEEGEEEEEEEEEEEVTADSTGSMSM